MAVGRPNGLDSMPMAPVRTGSFSSDIMSSSTRSTSTAQLVPHANPPPAYIARGEASSLLSKELERNVDASPPALTLLNDFLDHVLYSVISTAHSVALGQLKAAVPAVLKPRLGKTALRVAEEELKEYMEDEEEEELYTSRNAVSPRSHFDADLVWKLARLRCMVYARMGDLEEEDEEEWLEKEHLLEQAAASPIDARQSMAVTPGAAIFLTSVIEYLGEQALYYAAQYAQKRHDNARNQDSATPTSESQLAAMGADIVLEGKDMNHVGRDSPLSRLWRSWRRNTRSPVEAISRPLSPETMLSPSAESYHSRATSNAHPSIHSIPEEHRAPTPPMPAATTPSQIPLPLSDDDVDEIGTEEDEIDLSGSRRPASMPPMPGRFPSMDLTPGVHDDAPPAFQERSPLRPSFDRARSNSVPTVKTPFQTPPEARRTSIVLPIQTQNGHEIDTIKEDGEVRGVNGVQDGTAVHDFAPADTMNTSEAQQTTTRKRTPSPEELNTTVGVLASALGTVGVHHINQEPQLLQHDRAEEIARKLSNVSDEPLTSASIKGADDFDMMYVPEGRNSPDDQIKSQDTKAVAELPASQPTDPYQEMEQKQFEEHKRYSQMSHEMDTPSMYSTREHSPRFPKDMRSTSSQNSEPDVIATNYAPASAPDMRDRSYPALPASAIPVGATQSQFADSPVSATSSKLSRQLQSNPESVPDIPQFPTRYQHQVDERTPGHARGHSKSSSSSSRLLGFTRDATGRPQTIYQQNAAGDMTDAVRQAHSSTPNSMNRIRPDTAHTPPASPRQHLRLRSDSENNMVKAPPNDEAAKRSLEVLINSDQTLLYTTTPDVANFRPEDVSVQPRAICHLANPCQINRSPPRTQTQELAEFLKHTSPPGEENATPKPTTRSRKVSMEAGRAPQALSGQREHDVVPSSQGVIMQAPPTPKSKNPLGEPRDAKVDRTSNVRDLADYVRSTGPSNDDQLAGPVTIGPPAPAAKRSAEAATSTMAAPTLPKLTKKRSARLQARDPRPSRNAESSALIDFIREGPPRQPGDHRINRHVAPFRTTMDSDDLNGLVSSLPKDSSDNGVSSIATTTNSHTPLVNHEAKMGGTPQPRAIAQPDPDDPMPKRTRRRVKDPYAIDDSDDEELFSDQPPPKKATNEESLIDFLRNTAPPSTMTAQPVLSSVPSTTTSSLTRKPSIDKIKEFVRGNRSTTPASDNVRAQAQAQSRARAESPHLTQSGSKLDSYRPTQPTHANHVERNRASKSRSENRNSGTSTNGSGQTGAGYGATADMAEFLKNTGPPPSQPEVQPFILNGRPNTATGTRQDGGLKKFFSMRGKR